jgi:hypothetical protein
LTKHHQALSSTSENCCGTDGNGDFYRQSFIFDPCIWPGLNLPLLAVLVLLSLTLIRRNAACSPAIGWFLSQLRTDLPARAHQTNILRDSMRNRTIELPDTTPAAKVAAPQPI